MSNRCVLQVEKSGLITGSRLGADNEYEFDELEVFLTKPTLMVHCLVSAWVGATSDAAAPSTCTIFPARALAMHTLLEDSSSGGASWVRAAWLGRQGKRWWHP